MHSWMIRNDRHTILVDTGCGNDKTRALPLFERFHQLHLPYLERLAEAGVQPEDVTLVICTHLHIDHVGWNTRLVDGEWVPTFPNAKYIFSRREFEHWQSPTGGHVTLPENIAVIEDSVLPVIEAGQVEFIDDGSKIIEGLFFQDAIGHTAGHGMLKLESGDDAAIFPGDSLHQPMQVFRPDWNSRFCEQADQARATQALDPRLLRRSRCLAAARALRRAARRVRHPARRRLRLQTGGRPRRGRLIRSSSLPANPPSEASPCKTNPSSRRYATAQALPACSATRAPASTTPTMSSGSPASCRSPSSCRKTRRRRSRR